MFAARLVRTGIQVFRDPLGSSPRIRRLIGPSLISRRYENELRKVDALQTNYSVGTRGLGRCQIRVINLPHRKDRLESFFREVQRLDMPNVKVFEAIPQENGALGCSLSHQQVLREADLVSSELLMICEDDCEFLVERPLIDEVIEEFYKNPKLDVLCLGYNAPFERQNLQISKNLRITENTQTTSCYVVRPKIVSLLESVAASSADHLRSSRLKGLFEYDLMWKSIQTSYFFAIPTYRIVKQRAGYSDIEGAQTDYGV